MMIFIQKFKVTVIFYDGREANWIPYINAFVFSIPGTLELTIVLGQNDIGIGGFSFF
jgi:hypothetical protein